MMVVGAAAVLMGGRLLRAFTYAFFAVGLIIIGISVIAFLSFSSADFAAIYGRYFPGGVPKVFADAAVAGYSPGLPGLGAQLVTAGFVMPVLFGALGPYPMMQFMGGEIKNPRRTLLYGVVLAEIVSILIWFGLTSMFDRTVGISFLEAWTVTAGGGFSTVPTVFVTMFYANTTLAWLMAIGLFIGNVGWAWLGLLFISRIIMALSFDRALPSKLASVNERFHTPHIATVLAVVMAMVPMYLYFFTSYIAASVNSNFFQATAYLLTALATVLFPFRRKSIFEASAGHSRVGGIPVLSLLGLAGMVAFAYLDYNSMVNPVIGPFAFPAQVLIVILIAVSLALYVASYYYNKSQGIDLRQVCAEIPPE